MKMRRTRIKVCCIASIDEMRLASELGADAIGLVGAMPSGPGPIADELVLEIARATPPSLARFLLTSRTRGDDIADHAAACGVDTVQIVAHVDPREHLVVASRVPHVRRVQVLHVEGRDALELAAAYEPHVHALLLDSGRPGAEVPELGGTGRTHDWSVSAELVRRSRVPVFLAGGLNASNVGEAIASVRPFGVDLCSGVRTAGRLDRAKLAAFVAAVRASEH